MMASCKEERQWSVKKMEFGEGLKTLECLRGRLLAERQASRSAREQAEFMGEKLKELENQIRKEAELRNKAEKRLKLLIKKLESLNITSTSITSKFSTLSEISTNASTTKEIEDQKSRSESLASTISENQDQKVPEITTSKQRNEKKKNLTKTLQIEPITNSSPNSESSNVICIDPLKSPKEQIKAEVKKRDSEHYINNLAALVTGAAPAAKSEAGAMKMNGIHERATDVNDDPKQIRGNVQSLFEGRNHMKVIMSM